MQPEAETILVMQAAFQKMLRGGNEEISLFGTSSELGSRYGRRGSAGRNSGPFWTSSKVKGAAVNQQPLVN